jgi:hypothetical protein
MEDFFKYTTKSIEDKNWGLYINVAGCANILPGECYPPPGHPSEYSFSWENGRILHEFQINYITSGEGILETRSGKYPVREGSVIIVFPGMWHRYRPSKTGWKEHYVGFNGTICLKMNFSQAGILFFRLAIMSGFYKAFTSCLTW